MRIVNNQISTTVKNAIWNTDRIYYDLVNNESYFETGGGDLSWILSLSNPNNNISFNENQPITIKFYLGDGTLVDENTMWKDAESSNDSNHPLINTEADNGNIVWDDDESQFIVSLLSNNSCALPCWGGNNGVFNEPPSGYNRCIQVTMVVSQPNDYNFIATIRGNALHKYRVAKGGFYFSNEYYMCQNYTYGGISLNNHFWWQSPTCILPWFRERYLPTYNTNPDWCTTFVVVNAGDPGYITISVKNLDGSNTDLTTYTPYFNSWQKIFLMPSQFKQSGDDYRNGLDGRIEVKRATNETNNVKPVCLGIQFRFPKSTKPEGSPQDQKFRIPSYLNCEPFHIIYQ